MSSESDESNPRIPPTVGVILMVILTIALAALFSSPLQIPDQPLSVEYDGHQNGTVDLHIANAEDSAVQVSAAGTPVETVHENTTVRVNGLSKGDSIRVVRQSDNVRVSFVYLPSGAECHEMVFGYCYL